MVSIAGRPVDGLSSTVRLLSVAPGLTLRWEHVLPLRGEQLCYGPTMDRALIISCLQAAEAEVANSERLIVNQCKLIWSLERTGEDTTNAIALFREMERMQLEHLDDRDQLFAELAVIDAVDTAKAKASAIPVSRLGQRRKRSA